MDSKETRRNHFLSKAREAREHAEMAGPAWAKELLQEIARGFEQLAAKEEGDQYAYRKRLQPDRQ